MPKSLLQFFLQCKEKGTTGMDLYNRYQEYLDSKCRVARIPYTGSFEITPLCNLDCKMCYVHLQKDQMQGINLLPFETWKEIASQAIDAGMFRAVVTGGECLTVPWFPDFYLFLQSKGVEVTVKTNALLIRGKLLELFKKHPPKLLSVSVYGADDNGYEAVTGHRVFTQVMDSLDLLVENKVPLLVSVTLSNYMKDSSHLLHVLSEHKLNWVINPRLNPPNENTKRAIQDATNETYAELYQLSVSLQGESIANECEDSCPAIGGAVKTVQPISCAAGRSSFNVNWRGELSPCISFPGAAFDAVSLGFKEAWRRIGQVIDSFKTPVQCVGCAYRNKCTSCIIAHSNSPIKGHADPAICERTKYLVGKGILKLGK